MNENLIEMLIADDFFKVKSVEYLRNELEVEMQKENPHIDIINELVLAIDEAENMNQTEFDTAEEYKKIRNMKRKNSIFKKMGKVAVAVCTIFALSNAVTFSTYGESLVSVMSKSGKEVFIKFFGSDEITDNVIRYDEYGVKKYYEELGLTVEAPMYFPDGFEITTKRPDENIITLSNGEKQVDISFRSENLPALTVKGDNPDESYITVNGHRGTYIEDERADWLVYQFNDIVAVYDFQNLSHEEIEKIISSIE